MAEPKKRLSGARSGARRSHIYKKKLNLSSCAKCHEPALPHRVCPNCGFYKGTDVLKLEEKAKAKEERRKAREQEEAPEGKKPASTEEK